MKKILASAVVLTLVAVPSVALAQRNDQSTGQQTPSGSSQSERTSVEHRANLNASVVKELETENEDVATSLQTPSGSITLAQAEAIAQAQFPDKTIVKVETEQEDGSMVFSVRFSDGSRVDVSATGQVLRSQAGSQGDDHDDNSGPSGDSGRSDD